jgi:hypothetical protein
MLPKITFLLLLSLFSFQVNATPINILFEGEVFLPVGSGFSPTDPSAAFTALVSYDTDTPNLTPGSAPTSAKYGPVSISFTVGTETAFLSDARLNVDSLEILDFEGIQWVDDSAAWSGTLFGSSVDTLAINFGRSFGTGLPLDIVSSVDLSEWNYHNGCFTLSVSNGDETCFDINNATMVPEPSTIVLMLLGLMGLVHRVAKKRQLNA